MLWENIISNDFEGAVKAAKGVCNAFHFLKNENISDTYHAEWLEKQ